MTANSEEEKKIKLGLPDIDTMMAMPVEELNQLMKDKNHELKDKCKAGEISFVDYQKVTISLMELLSIIMKLRR